MSELAWGYARRLRRPRQDQVNAGAHAELAVEREPAAQLFRDDGVYGVQSKTGRACMAAGGEKWIKGLTLDLGRHTAAVVGHHQIDVIGPCGADAYIDRPLRRLAALRERMGQGIDRKMIQDLSEWSRIAVHFKISLARKPESDVLFPELAGQM